jgi:hypothetical protein
MRDRSMPHPLSFHWQAEASHNALSPAERQKVLRALGRVRTAGVRVGPTLRPVRGGNGAGKLYVLRVGDDLDVMLTLHPDNTLSVEDVMNRRLAQRYG